MPYLDWIDDKNLEIATTRLLKKAIFARKNAPKKLHKNVIDPFSAMFQMAGFDLDHHEYHLSEISRQAQKSYQNHVGTFHQEILGYVENWEDLGTGHLVDLKSDNRKIIAEIKNKHNTVTGSKLCDVYDTIYGAVMQNLSIYKGYVGYFVNIIPKTKERFDLPFTPSDNKTKTRRELNDNIRITDGASFYALVSGSENALSDLFSILPSVIHKILEKEVLSNNEISQINEYFNRAYIME